MDWLFLLGEERHTQRKREKEMFKKKKGIINNK